MRNARIASLSALLALCMACSRTVPQRSNGTETIAHAAGSRKLALLVGINHYKYPDRVPTLDGTLNDVEAMKRVLTSSRYGFDPHDIHVLTNEQATHDNILKNEIEGFLIKNATPGSIIVFHYSGHGSRMEDPKDPSGYDNTIVPFDSRDPGNKVPDIRDKEINSRLRKLSDIVGPTGGVTIILDSCHSGTGAKAAGTSRQAPDDKRFGKNPPPLDLAGTPAGERDVEGSGYSDRGIHYALIAGSRTDQTSFELQIGSETHGALTYYLVRELERPSPVQRTYRDIMIPVIAGVNQQFPNQVPQLEGDNQNSVVFGDRSIQPQRYIDSRTAPDKRVELEAGNLLGMTSGSEFDIYSADAQRLEPPDKPLARVKLNEIKAFTSLGLPTSGGPILVAAKAVERIHVFEPQQTSVFYDKLAASPALQKIKAVLERHPNKPFREVPANQPFLIRLEQRGDKVYTFGPDGAELSAGVTATDAMLAERMERRMLDWARWFGLRQLNHAGSALQVTIELIPTGDANPAPHDRVPGFTPGDNRFVLKIKNLTDRKLFLYILDIVDTGEVQLAYPDPGSHVPIEPKKESVIDQWNPGLPKPQPGAIAPTRVRDVLKLIATSNQVDLRYLEMEAPKGVDLRKGVKGGTAPNDPLNQLLFDASMGRRNASRGVADDWSTAEVMFDVCQQVDANRRCR